MLQTICVLSQLLVLALHAANARHTHTRGITEACHVVFTLNGSIAKLTPFIYIKLIL